MIDYLKFQRTICIELGKRISSVCGVPCLVKAISKERGIYDDFSRAKNTELEISYSVVLSNDIYNFIVIASKPLLAGLAYSFLGISEQDVSGDRTKLPLLEKFIGKYIHKTIYDNYKYHIPNLGLGTAEEQLGKTNIFVGNDELHYTAFPIFIAGKDSNQDHSF